MFMRSTPTPATDLVAHRHRPGRNFGYYRAETLIPAGIIGTPVVDLASRRLFFDALISGSPIKHFIFSLNVDTGATTAGWPVDVNATASYNGINFVSLAQENRGSTGSCEWDRVRVLLRVLR